METAEKDAVTYVKVGSKNDKIIFCCVAEIVFIFYSYESETDTSRIWEQ